MTRGHRTPHVVLLSLYELGRQPFGLASPAAWLGAAGANVRCNDLAVEPLREDLVARADLVAVHVPMHTATRLAVGTIRRVRELNPSAPLACYGLYAPMNEAFLRTLGVDVIVGGEFESGLAALVRQLVDGRGIEGGAAVISLDRQRFVVPDRSTLPSLESYAQLTIDGERRTVGYTEASRGCKHRCRHCPIVPVYGGRFRIVDRDVVAADVRQQVRAGARHVTFGDPDFFNGPTHALRIVRALHEEFPSITYDVTIKVEHLLKHATHLETLRDTGCVLITSAVESVDDETLAIYEKSHTRADFRAAVQLLRDVGIALNPTFVTFSPWTTREGYLDLLALIAELGLVANVAPIQYAIRLLIPRGSRLLELPEVRQLVEPFDEEALCYPWRHPDPGVDRLYEAVLEEVRAGTRLGETRDQVYARVWRVAAGADTAGVPVTIEAPPRATVPYLNEPWYC